MWGSPTSLQVACAPPFGLLGANSTNRLSHFLAQCSVQLDDVGIMNAFNCLLDPPSLLCEKFAWLTWHLTHVKF